MTLLDFNIKFVESGKIRAKYQVFGLKATGSMRDICVPHFVTITCIPIIAPTVQTSKLFKSGFKHQ
jgi:hypothetical protein